MNNRTNTNPVSWTFVSLAALACLGVLLTLLALLGFTDKAFVYAIRVIVKIAFTFFALSYIAAPLYRFSSGRAAKFLMRHRATTGAAFAACHLTAGISIAFIWFNFRYVIEAISTPVDRVLGLIALSWIALMLVTSSARVQQAIGARAWGLIHKYGMMLIWIGYMLDYGRRALQWHPVFGFFVAVLLTILVLRLAALFGRGASSKTQHVVQG
ncbi:hypothetical protein ACIP1T_16575 [Pseudomonas japonica]|uniref:hypothetical protein n=1 Tax=Pseudomonas TaxID=286 RepID=UPI0029285E41|nr:hypothetical protein [Pseudomonas sp. zfem002]MDU9391292.1 hypothetical protein [Pseudomonas sp. zfem002]